MLPEERIQSLLDELEKAIEESKIPFMGSDQTRVVDINEMYEIIDEIRDVVPTEVKEATNIVRERDEMLDQAQRQANSIISDAQQQAVILAGDQEVVRLAQQQANQIRFEADEYERKTRRNAEDYALQVITSLENNLNNITSAVNRVHQTLDENTGSYGDDDNGRSWNN